MWEDWREITASGAPPFRVSHQQTFKGKASISEVHKKTIQNKFRNLEKNKKYGFPFQRNSQIYKRGHYREIYLAMTENSKSLFFREMTAPGHYSSLPPAGCRPWSCTHTRQGGTGGRAPVQLLLGPLGVIFVYYESTTM